MVGFIFSGQGAQKPRMGQELYNCSPAARAVFDQVSSVAGRDISSICFKGAQDELNLTENTQPCVLATDLAAMAALRERNIQPDICAGFSLGEYAALVCANVLDVNTAADLVMKRARYMSQCEGGGMAAVIGLGTEELEEICASVRESIGFVTPVNYNCPGQTVVAGDKEALAELSTILKTRKIRMLPLKVSGAFHCKHMEPAANLLYHDLCETDFRTAAIPIVCNTTAQPFDPQKENWAETLKQQACSPVYWEQSIRYMLKFGVTVFIECGFGKVLAGLNKRICPDITSFTVEDEASLQAAASVL